MQKEEFWVSCVTATSRLSPPPTCLGPSQLLTHQHLQRWQYAEPPHHTDYPTMNYLMKLNTVLWTGKMRQNTSSKTNLFKIECCGSSGQLPTERMRRRVLGFRSEIGSLKGLKIVASAVHTAKIEMKISLTRAWERVTSACRCRRVSVSVQSYSVQCKGYNLIGVTTVEEGTVRGMTTLVYLQLLISLYTGTVHVLSRVAGVHLTSLTGD
jgi:hypothetical protein